MIKSLAITAIGSPPKPAHEWLELFAEDCEIAARETWWPFRTKYKVRAQAFKEAAALVRESLTKR